MHIVHCVSTAQSQAFWDAFNMMLSFGMHQWGILTRKTRLPIKKKKGGARSKVLVNR